MNLDTRFYIPGGALPPDAASYVPRRADAELLEGLLAGEFCYVLDTRQMGKSSLMVRTAARLQELGATVLALDLTAVGQNVTVEQWYDGLLNQMGRELCLEDEVDDFWRAHRQLGPMQRWMSALREVALSHCRGPLVVFVDEIDVVRSLPFSTDEFFAGIRECFNLRARQPELNRLTFCLLGVATPASLIRSVQMTPFNIGRRIELSDFTPAEAAPLAKGLEGEKGRKGEGETKTFIVDQHLPLSTTSKASGENDSITSVTPSPLLPFSPTHTSTSPGQRLLARILYWTGGHPYLTQRLCQALATQAIQNPKSKIQNSEVDRLCTELFLSRSAQERDDNLLFVRDRIVRDETDLATTLELYAQIRAGKLVRSDDLRPAVTTLLLSGIVRAEGDHLRVRNRIYSRVFDQRWVRDRMPDAELRRQRAAYRRGLLRATTVAASIVLAMVVLVLIAVGSARRAEQNRQEANNRTAQVQQLAQKLKTTDESLVKQNAALRQETDRRRRAELAAQQKERQARAAQQRSQEEQRRADAERTAAVRQKNLAQARQEHLQVAYGTRLMDEGDLSGALLWFAQAAGLDAANPSRLTANRMRIAAILHHMPRLAHLWFDVRSARFSPDGRRVVTGHLDGTARIWDAESGAPLARPMRHLMRPMPGGIGVVQARFSPDGRQVLTYGGYTAQVWDATTGEPLTRPLVHPQRVLDAEFSPDGRRIVTEVEGDTARIWDVGSGQVTAELEYPNHEVHHAEFSPDGHRVVLSINCAGRALIWDVVSGARHTTVRPDLSQIGYASFSPDGSRIVIADGNDKDGSARIFDTATGRPITPPLPHGACVYMACFSPDGTRVATASADNTARVWNAKTGEPISPPLPHEADVAYVCFSPDGHRVATTSADMTARIWDTETGEPLSPPLRHADTVQTAAFDAEGRRLLTWDDSGIARLWDVAGAELPDGFAGEYSNVACAAFSPDGKRLATGDFDYTAQIWDVETGRPISPLLAHGAPVRDLAFSPDGKRLSTASDDGKARIWDTANGRLLATLPHPLKVSHLAFSADGRRVATTSRNSGFVWDAATGRPVCALCGHTETINSVAFSPDGARVVTAGDDAARVWDGTTGMLFMCLRHRGIVMSACFSPDGRRLLTACSDHIARLWDASSGRSLRPLRQVGKVTYAAFSADGRRILTTNGGYSAARVWNAATGEPITPPLQHRNAVLFAAFSHDGHFVVTCSDDCTVRVWDAASGEPITPPLRHESFVRWAAFSPDDRRVLTLCGDGIARIWTLPQDRHSPAELRQLAQLLAAHRIDASGGLAALEPRELRAAWNAFPSSQCEELGPTRAQLQAWRIAEASADVEAAEQQQETSRLRQGQIAEGSTGLEAETWTRAIFHLDRLLEVDPSNRWACALRAYAHAQLGQWRSVSDDRARISGSGGCLIVLESHRPVQKVLPQNKPLQIGKMLYHHALTCAADHTILALLPAPGKRFTATVGVAGVVDSAATDGISTFSVDLGGREAFRSSEMRARQPGAAVAVPLNGATALVLRSHHTGGDLYAAWADARVDLMDGRTLSLSDLPLHPLGGL